MFRCVELLIAYDANINHAADEGQTPLYLACKNGNKECIKYLLEAGTDRSVETRVSTNFGRGLVLKFTLSANSIARKSKYIKIEVALFCFAFWI